ncbi:MAG: IclR family transcriptional regulator [Qingshengfaniella sp.]
MASSLDRVLAVLGVFSEDRLEWGFDALMAELGYSRPTLYRYIRTLKEAGFLIALPGARFTLGPKVVELDYLMWRADPLVRESGQTLDGLIGRWSCTALLVRWYGKRLLCVASATSMDNPVSSYPRGKPMPLARGAISRAILAFLPRRRQIPMIADHLEDLRAIGLGDTVDEVADALRRIKRQGYTSARGEVTPGVIGIAAPVFQDGADPAAALCVTLRETDIAPEDIPRIGTQIRHAADELSLRLSMQDGTSDAAGSQGE